MARGRPKPGTIRRECLRCLKYFWSEGPFNKLCASCNTKNAAEKTTYKSAVDSAVIGGRVMRKKSAY